jgi:N-acetylneuraminate synthase
MANKFKQKTGWSDHSVSDAVIYRAVHRYNSKVIEFHLDLDGDGAEFKSGHCWLPAQIENVIRTVNAGIESDGTSGKRPLKCEEADRLWRTDKNDGLRPLKQIRAEFKDL